MSTASNKLIGRSFAYTTHSIPQTLLPSPVIPWFFETNQQIRITVHKAVKTPNIKKPRSVTVLLIPRDTQIAGWLLKSLLIVQLTPTRKGSVATTWLEGIAEYGAAENETDAITDVVTSLGEYKEALEEREENLGDSARRELDLLRKLIERSS